MTWIMAARAGRRGGSPRRGAPGRRLAGLTGLPPSRSVGSAVDPTTQPATLRRRAAQGQLPEVHPTPEEEHPEHQRGQVSSTNSTTSRLRPDGRPAATAAARSAAGARWVGGWAGSADAAGGVSVLVGARRRSGPARSRRGAGSAGAADRWAGRGGVFGAVATLPLVDAGSGTGWPRPHRGHRHGELPAVREPLGRVLDQHGLMSSRTGGGSVTGSGGGASRTCAIATATAFSPGNGRCPTRHS